MSEIVRAEIRFKNAALYNALKAEYPPQNSRQKCADLKRAAQESSVPYPVLISLLNLATSPYLKDGQVRPHADRLCNFLAIPLEELFPLRLYSNPFPKIFAHEIDVGKYLSFTEARQAHLLPSSTEELGMDLTDLREDLEKVMSSLTPREQGVLRQRMGFEGEVKTLREVAALMALTPERIRQIEIKALRELRHPSRAVPLRGYWDERD